MSDKAVSPLGDVSADALDDLGPFGQRFGYPHVRPELEALVCQGGLLSLLQHLFHHPGTFDLQELELFEGFVDRLASDEGANVPETPLFLFNIINYEVERDVEQREILIEPRFLTTSFLGST